ncbi:pancreatic lipase-related protein 2-like isoform X3 [Rhodnius prolixus]
MKSAPFVENVELRVLIHGYTGHKDYSPNMELRPAFLDYNDINIISVDWSPLARPPCYVQAAVNTDVVGQCTAKFLASLFTVRPDVVSCNNTHVIGFSLGAHVAGGTGKYLQELGCKLGWISGLDPALPLFSEIGAKPEYTLDSTDADFVDVIHTNVGWKGQFGPEGHADFYITNGYAQPGCVANSSCDHVRAVEIYSESISSSTGFYGAPCGLYIKSFLFGFVRQVCVMSSSDVDKYILVGLHVPHDARGTYQVMTHDMPPYAKGRTASLV